MTVATATTADRGGPAQTCRGTTTARGYGADHQRNRADWAPYVATGHVKCAGCGQHIAHRRTLGRWA